MAQLNNCPHCGSVTEFIVDSQGSKESIFARCTGCKIQTQSVASSLEYSAKDKIADIWNATAVEEWPEWIQPKGAHDAYSKGSKVAHREKVWISNIDANVWEPGVSGWTEQKGGAI
jgi:hypothetical protein